MSELEKKTIVTEERQAAFAGLNISWSSVFAGVVSFIALQILFGFVTSAIGFGVADLNESSSLANMGTGLAIWTVISQLLTFAISGLVVGITSARQACVHGFLSWSLSIIMTMVILTSGIASVFAGIGRVIGTVGSGVGQAVTSVAGGTAELVNAGFEEATKGLQIDTSIWSEKAQKVMKDSEEEKLQPEYLQGQLNQVVEEAKLAAKNVATNPESFNSEAEKLFNSIQEKIEKIGSDIDENTVAKAVAKNSDLSESEAKEVTQNIIEGYHKAAEEANKQLDAAKVKFEELKQDAIETAENVKDTANDAMNTVSSASLITFFVLVLTLVVTVLASIYGRKLASRKVYHVVR